jgi:hypothetical protein
MSDILDLPVCGFIKAYRYFRPVPDKLERKVVIKLSMPWLKIKHYILTFFPKDHNIKITVSPALGSFMLSNASFAYQILVYADREENKYVLEFKREGGDIFANLDNIDNIRKMLLQENERHLKTSECDAKDSHRKFYYNELGEEVYDE